MTVSFYEYFLTNKYDERIILRDVSREYSVKDVKSLLGKEIPENETLQSIVDFINKMIFTENQVLEFYTSGSTSSKGKCVKKTLQNLLKETDDLYQELKLNENLEFISTTTLEHVYGFTFYCMLPLNKGGIINLDRINYPEDIKVNNAVLITTPSFLESLKKYEAKVDVKPKIIISAGSRLSDETFKYARKLSERVIDLYGSTETGSIAYRESYKTNYMKLFPGIHIISTLNNETKLSTDYSYDSIQVIGDRMKVRGGDKIEPLGRADRVLKVQEKRILAEDIENEMKKSELVSDCYVFENSCKIASLTVLTEKGQEFVIKNGGVELKKLLKTSLNDKFEVVPQRWKFIDEIPRTQRGKIDTSRATELFDLNLSLPLVLSRTCEKDVAEFELRFLRSSNFFQGHFEGMPILAGVVQFFYANFFIKEAFGINCSQGQIRKVKFSNIIRPDQIIRLRLMKTGSNISFKYEDDNKVYSSGIFPMQNYL